MPKLDFRVRPAKKQDCEEIADLMHNIGWLSTVNEESFNYTVKRLQNIFDTHNMLEQEQVFVAQLGSSKIVGCICVQWNEYLQFPSTECFVSDLLVREEYRGKGIGTALLDKIKAIAKRKKCYRIMLLNGKHRDSYKRGFYTKKDFIERNEFMNFVCYL